MNKALEILKNIKCWLVHPHHIPYINEAIAELEAQEAKSCKNCKKQDLPSIKQIMACGHCKQLARDNFEPKGTK